MFYVSIFIAAIGLTIYHLSLKRTPHDINPMIFLAFGYVIATGFCIALYKTADGKMPWTMMDRSLFITLLMLSAGVALIEIGTLLAYRHGWVLGTAGPTSNALATLPLLVIAYVFYQQKLSATQLLGMAFCIVGLVLLSRKG